MQTTLINHPKLHVWFQTGSEGPRHDPYGYDEYCIETPEHKIVFHEGLAVWIKIDGVKTEPFGRDYDRSRAWGNTFITELTGHTLQQFERWSRNAKSRCPMGGQHDLQWFDGYPGECIAECHKCKRFVDSTFDRSAIE